MKNNLTPLLDEHLESLAGINENTTDEYFYTRLKEKINNRAVDERWMGVLKPVWIAGSMAVLFIINVFMLSVKEHARQVNVTKTNKIKSFAEAYDQTISSF